MRVCFLVHELAPSGGVATICAHAARLSGSGRFDVELVVTGPTPDGSVVPPDGVPVLPLADARGAYDAAIATWWETIPALWVVDAGRRVVFLQSLEQRFYGQQERFERLGAALALALPAGYIAVSTWIRDALVALRPDVRCQVVPNGVDKQVFAARPREPREGPLRVLVEGQPGLPFKGVAEAVEAVRAMREPAQLTLVALDREDAERAGLPVDRVVGELDARGMADLYAESDVLLKLSRFEGLGMAPLEAFHLGVPCIVTPYGGHADYVDHERNGVITDFDDLAATTGWLDRLAVDRELLGRLSDGALRTAAEWPGLDEAGARFATALEQIVDDPPPDAELAFGALVRLVELEVALGREEVRGLRGALEWNERALEETRQVAEAYRKQLVELTGSRAHQAVERVRRLTGKAR